MAMVKCKRFGCGKEFDCASNDDSSCTYHCGWPVFHDVRKRWSCCKRENMDWNEFMLIPGCATGCHSDVAPEKPAVKSTVYDESCAPQRVEPVKQVVVSSNEVKPDPVQDDEVKIPHVNPDGSHSCSHVGCQKKYFEAENVGEVCKYHAGKPTFHDGKKMWTCCKASSYDWDDFMKLPTCMTGVHEPKLVKK